MGTFIVAEAGSCHDADLDRARALVGVAVGAGADACKFQFWSSAKRLAERRRAPNYEAIYEQYRVPEAWLPRLAADCAAHGIEFMCTVYLPEDIAAVAPYVNRFKVASFEASDVAFIAAHLPYDKPVIVSTGMQQMRLPLNRLDERWALVRFLHCVSAYPAPIEQANLAVLRDQETFWGYSDHTASVLTGAFAVCAGARMLEVHFRDRVTDPKNPDYATALSPFELSEYVRLVRIAERMLGSGRKEPQPAEAMMQPYRVQP